MVQAWTIGVAGRAARSSDEGSRWQARCHRGADPPAGPVVPCPAVPSSGDWLASSPPTCAMSMSGPLSPRPRECCPASPLSEGRRRGRCVHRLESGSGEVANWPPVAAGQPGSPSRERDGSDVEPDAGKLEPGCVFLRAQNRQPSSHFSLSDRGVRRGICLRYLGRKRINYQRAVRADDLVGSVIGHTRDLAAKSRDDTVTRSVPRKGALLVRVGREGRGDGKPMVGSRLWSRERALLPCQCSPRRSAAARTRCCTLSQRCCRRRADPWPMDLSAAAPS